LPTSFIILQYLKSSIGDSSEENEDSMSIALNGELEEYLKTQGLYGSYFQHVKDGQLTLSYGPDDNRQIFKTDDVQALVNVVGNEGLASMLRGGDKAAGYFEMVGAGLSPAPQQQQSPTPGTTPPAASDSPGFDENYHNNLQHYMDAELKRAGVEEQFKQGMADGFSFTKADGTVMQLQADQALSAAHLLGARGFAEALTGNAKELDKLQRYADVSCNG